MRSVFRTAVSMCHSRILLATVAAALHLPAAGSAAGGEPTLRRPAAIVTTPGKAWIANRLSGTVSVVDTSRLAVLAEHSVGGTPVDAVLLDRPQVVRPDGQSTTAANQTEATGVPAESQLQLLLADRQNRQLVLCDLNPWQTYTPIPLAGAPEQLAVSPSQKWVAATLKWSRAIAFGLTEQLPPGSDSNSWEYLELPFAPHQICAVRLASGQDGFIVASAFEGQIAVVDPARRRIVRTLEFAGHNIRGLAVSSASNELLIAHQVLQSDEPTMYEEVFWGGVLQNALRALPLPEVLDANAQVDTRLNPHSLGHPSDAAGDPGCVATFGAATVVLLAGVNDVAYRSSPTQPFVRFDVGRHPIDVAADQNAHRLLVINEFADSLTVVHADREELGRTVSLGPVRERSAVERGEELFYDARLSLSGWYSCHSCHTDGHSNGKLNDNFGDRTTGAPKRVLPLGGVAETAPWAWIGNVQRLEHQVKKSIETTMQGNIYEEQTITDLAAYLRTLPPAPSVLQSAVSKHSAMVEKERRAGQRLFAKLGCVECHAPPLYTTAETYDVGLADQLGQSEFNPPSLRGVSQRSRLFHDGRANSLHDAFKTHQHGLSEPLSETEQQQLIRFLQSL